MSTDRETTRIVRSWLEDGATVLPDRVLDAVSDELSATQRRRSWWPVRRFPHMTRLTQGAIAVAAVIVLAFVGLRFLPGDSGVGGPPLAAPTSSPSPTVVASPSAATYPLLNDQANLDGRYAVGSGITSRVTVQVPSGWSAGGDWVVKGPAGNQAPAGMAVRFYPAMQLYKNPLKAADGFLTVGPTVDDLANAIASRPGWTATANVAFTIGGIAGKLVNVTIPPKTVIGSDGMFLMFGDASGPQVWGFTPGQVFDIYIVEVAGQRVVIEAFYYPGTSASDLAAQQAVLESIQIDAGT